MKKTKTHSLWMRFLHIDKRGVSGYNKITKILSREILQKK